MDITNNIPKSDANNYIDLVIHRIAVDKGDTSLIKIIENEIIKEVQISRRLLTCFLENTIQPTRAQIIAIASVLKKYSPNEAAALQNNTIAKTLKKEKV